MCVHGQQKGNGIEKVMNASEEKKSKQVLAEKITELEGEIETLKEMTRTLIKSWICEDVLKN